MLSEFLQPEKIQFLPRAENWREAIRCAAAPMLQCASLTEGYIEKMIAAVEEHGPYIVLDAELALPHARPQDGALRTDMSMLVLGEAVDMLGEPVRVLIALSASDNTGHLDAMKALAEFVWAGGSAKSIAACGSPAAAAAHIKKMSKGEKE